MFGRWTKKKKIIRLDASKVTDAYLLIASSYDDYLAARLLINSGLIFQGATMANYAIEKYLKVYLKLLNVSYNYFHLETKSLDRIKRYFKNTQYRDILSLMDQGFLKILSRTFDWRYHDNIQQPENIGFLINQFLGELDCLYNRMDKMFSIDGWATKYKREVAEKNEFLFQNNFVLNGIDKAEFMSRSTRAFILYYNPTKQLMLDLKINFDIELSYEGAIQIINVAPGDTDDSILVW